MAPGGQALQEEQQQKTGRPEQVALHVNCCISLPVSLRLYWKQDFCKPAEGVGGWTWDTGNRTVE